MYLYLAQLVHAGSPGLCDCHYYILPNLGHYTYRAIVTDV